jgi:predicted RNase H-like HicB family nuclease
MQFEVEIFRNEAGEWVATAVEYAVSATGRTETEALARVMEALSTHLKKTPNPGAKPS